MKTESHVGPVYNTIPLSAKQISMGGLNPPILERKGKDTPLNAEPANDINQQCRICLNEDQSESDPLISPCRCTGTMANVHILCLQRWLFNKVVTREREECKTYSLQALECELCKMKFPDTIELSGKYHKLVDIPKPQRNFMILEEITRDLNRPQTVHVISFENKLNVRLGRGNDSDIRISDISVSRNHAFIRASNKGVYIEDNSSKFGTLVQIKRPLLLDTGSKLMVQSGRTLMELSTRNDNRGICSCFNNCFKGGDNDANKVVGHTNE